MHARRLAALGSAALALAAVLPATAAAQGPLGPITDLGTVVQGLGEQPATVPTQSPATPPYDATPAPTSCAPGAKPQPDVDGRVPAGAAADGLWCNLTLVSHQGTSGGFKVWRYVDAKGRECAYYDTALLFPLNAFNVNSDGLGVVVLDMTNPAKPQQTAMLTTPAMLSPHESVNLNAKRGLLAAVTGNPSTYPGYVDVYDISADCRKPALDFSGPLAPLGHESGFSADGRTFYATGTASRSVTAIDLTDPKNPRVVSQVQVASHGLSLSDDGNSAYIADPTGRALLILDTSEIQQRKAGAKATEVSRLTWPRASIPQNAYRFTEDGHPYVLEFDEYNASTLGNGSPDDVGAARIVDIADEKQPRVVANLRLAINNPEAHKKYGNDPGADGGQNGFTQGYAAHYCSLPTEVNPKLVACSFIVSGLRLFDISDITKPREVGYFVAPTQSKVENGFAASNFAMSKPQFVPERKEIWWTDGTSGFYVLRIADAVDKGASSTPAKPGAICVSKRRFTIHLPAAVKSAKVYVAGRRVKVRRGARRLQAVVDLRRFGKRTVAVRIVGRKRGGASFRQTRRYHTCRPGS